MYCNWLSNEEGIARDQWCYVNKSPSGSMIGLTLADQHLERTGYRLPTEAEWEYACRAETKTIRPFGDSVGLMCAYAWHSGNANGVSHPVATRKPNDLGVFDMLGNVFEWCHELVHTYPQDTAEYRNNGALGPFEAGYYVVRGGSYTTVDLGLRSASRARNPPTRRQGSIGFRVARTMPE